MKDQYCLEWFICFGYSFLSICIYNMIVEAPGKDGQPFIAMAVAGVLALIIRILFNNRERCEN